MSAQGTLDVTSLIKAGWRYTDWPKMEPAVWDEIVGAMGEDGFHLLSLAVHREGGRDGPIVAKRGQMVISPSGLERLRKWNAERMAAK